MDTVQFYTLHEYLASFDNLEDVPVVDPANRSFDADNEDGIDVRGDFRLDNFDRAELDGDFTQFTEAFTPHIDSTSIADESSESPDNQ